MPFLFIFAILIALIPIYWSFIVENYVAIGTVATAFAFLATAWAAFEARFSAKAAMKAVKLTSESLYEIRKSSFKQWLELLLEHHESIHDEVKTLMLNQKDISDALNNNYLSITFQTLTKRTEIIKYINHIISILEFIDKDFYNSSASVLEKKQYVDQLTNKINADVKLVIAILGLKVFNNGTYDPKRLNELLNKYNFFADAYFFKDALKEINFLDQFVKEAFDKNYRKSEEYYLEENIIKHNKEIINPLTLSDYKPEVKTKFAVMWAYNSLCQRHLKAAFENLPKFMKGTITYWLEHAPEKRCNHNEIFREYVGYNIYVPGVKPIKIKSARHLNILLDFYVRNENKYDVRNIILKGGTNKVYLDQYMLKLREYKLTNAYLMLENNPDKTVIIGKILAVVSENIAFYEEQLNKHLFNSD